MPTLLSDHIVEGELCPNTIEVVDKPGSGNANHRYDIIGFDTTQNPSNEYQPGYRACFTRLPIIFQNGTVSEDAGANGIRMEDLLAICIHRLEGFQSGPYSNKHNESALNHLREALSDLQTRTRARIANNTKHTMQK